jgi:hypothetical protein
MASVLLEDQCLIPGQISSLADFRRWSLSGDFPASGRIDWVASQIEVDTSPAAGGLPDRFVELEGPPDLIVEIVSDSSVKKDTRRLPVAYHEAQLPEFWLIDARLAEMRFTIYRWEPSGYVAAISPEGDPSSTVFGCKVTLLRTRNAAGRFVYDVVTTP